MYHRDILRNVSQSHVRYRCVLFALLTLVLASLSSGQPLNPGFEKGSGTAANQWISFGNAFRDSARPHSGTYAMKLFGQFTGGANVTGAYQDLRILPGHQVAVSAWAIHRAADAIAGDNYALLKIVYRDAANNDLASAESGRITTATPRDVFHLLSVSLGAAPANTHHASVFLLFVQPATTPFAAGALHFDDIVVGITKPGVYKTVWRDEFNGTALNLADWEAMIGDGTQYGLPSGWGNNELQYYTARPQNVSVSGGSLHLVARREQFQGKSYTSARLRTRSKQDFLYGRFEARIKVPAGQGLWSALWMMPTDNAYGTWAASGEIDIVETINTASLAFGTIHFGGQYPNNVKSGSSKTGTNGFADGFHIYRLDWEPDSLKWYVDGSLYYSRSSKDWFSSVATWNERAPFDRAFHLLTNLAVGGNWPGNPDGTTVFPAELQIDWIRVSKLVSVDAVKE